MNKKNLGLVKKYDVTRTDGKEVGDAIVLEFKDPIARVGILAWAKQMGRAGYNVVEADVYKKLAEMSVHEEETKYDPKCAVEI